MLRTKKPAEVYVSALKNGTYAVLNYNEREARIVVPGKDPVSVGPFGIALVR